MQALNSPTKQNKHSRGLIGMSIVGDLEAFQQRADSYRFAALYHNTLYQTALVVPCFIGLHHVASLVEGS